VNYYSYHIGDFNNATRHLTRIERSIYRDMLDLYYDTEQPLVIDRVALCRKLLARTEEESTAVEQVLNEFFTKTEQGWYHSRCEEGIEEYRKNISGKSAAGKASAAKREAERLAKLNERSTGVQHPLSKCATDEQLTIPQEPLPIPQEPVLKPSAKNRGEEYPPEFEEAWAAYPKRPGASKADSLKAWSARIKSGATAADILAGVIRYAAYVIVKQTEPEFVKQPATFFGPGDHFKADWTIMQPRGSPTKESRHSGFDKIDYSEGIENGRIT
jgi:uncharacterized protein YdaU (DUF1376 family)